MARSTLLDVPLPIVAAPMAGGPSTVDLARAVHGAGGFPFLAGGYKSAETLAEEITGVRQFSDTFGVNLFVPGTAAIDAAAFRAYADRIQPEADRYGIRLETSPVVGDDDQWPEKLAMLLADPVPVVTLTFGLPPHADIAALRRSGSRVLASVTTPAEANAAEEMGVDGLVVQGPAAGGHSAIFEPHRPIPFMATDDLVRRIRAVTTLPLIAAGGVDGPNAVRSLLQAGAEAVAIGTLLLRTPESGASATHKAALANPSFTETVITRAFTGRPARALRNDFFDRHDAEAPLGYPEIHHLTRTLRQAAAKAGDAQTLHLWAGTGFRNATEEPAAQVIHRLAAGL